MSSAIETKTKITNIPLSLITVDDEKNARQNYDEGRIKELSASIKSHGLLQSPVVRRVDSGFELVAGYRRFKALTALGVETADFAVIEVDEKDAAIVNLIENVNRETLTSYELAIGCKRLRDDHKMTGEQISRVLKGEGLDSKGKSKQNVNNLIRLLEVLDEQIVEAWKDGHEKATTYNLLKIATKEEHEDQWAMWQELCGVRPEGDKDGDEDGDEDGDGDGSKDPKEPKEPKPKTKSLVDVLAMIGALKKAVKDDSIEADVADSMIVALQWAAGKRAKIVGVKAEHFE